MNNRGTFPPDDASDWRLPFDLSPAEVGLLADDRLDRRDLTAAIVHLAVTGCLRFRNVSRDFRIEVANTRGLPEFERRLVRSVMRGRESVSLRASRGRLAPFHSQLVRTAWRRLYKEGFRGRRFGFRLRASNVLAITALFVCAFALTASWWVLVVAGGVGVGGLMIGRSRASWTPKGLEAVQRVRALKVFIESANRDSVTALPAGAWDLVLPYAIALGLRDEWLFTRWDQRTAPAWFETRHRLDVSVRALDRSVRALADRIRVYDRAATPARMLNLASRRFVQIRERYPTRKR